MPNLRKKVSQISYCESSDDENDCIDENSEDSDFEVEENQKVDDENEELNDEIGIDDLEDDDLNESMVIDSKFYGKNGFPWSIEVPTKQNVDEPIYKGRIQSGLLFSVANMKNISDFFFYILNDTILNLICNYTNKKLDKNEPELTIDELR